MVYTDLKKKEWNMQLCITGNKYALLCTQSCTYMALQGRPAKVPILMGKPVEANTMTCPLVSWQLSHRSNQGETECLHALGYISRGEVHV